MSKKRPVIDAIMRGVYFKDNPLDLDKGKYENRLQLLKVPRLTKERILRVNPELPFISDFKKTTGHTNVNYIGIEKENFIFNRVSLAIVVLQSNVEFWIKVRYSEPDNVYITLKNFVCTPGSAYVLSYDLPAQKRFNLEYQLSNANGICIVNYTFYFAEPIKEVLDDILSKNTEIDTVLDGIKTQVDKLTFDGSNNLLCETTW